jgi:hypothetical protein
MRRARGRTTRFEQIVVQRRAVDADKRAVTAQARVVDRLGDELLACSGLSCDEHRCVRQRERLDGGRQLAHRRAPADEIVAAVTLVQLASQVLEPARREPRP